AGGTVLETNTAVGLIKASAPAKGFTERVSANRAVFGAAKERVIGSAPKNGVVAKPNIVEKEGQGSATRMPAAKKASTAGADPLDHDDNGHGTHVAGTIAAAANGFGVSGVAPNVTLVNIRAGQDSGFFFLQPTVDALTYAGDAGIDVVNMSFFTDPWLYNCAANPADSPAEQAEQRTIIEATNRALNYAHNHGVTSVVALGNQHTDLGAPQPDATSPDFPSNSTRTRTVDNATCFTEPTEGPHTIGVGSFGPSQA